MIFRKRQPAVALSWECPACRAVNSDPSGLCAGCGARIDPDYIRRQVLAAGGLTESMTGILPARPQVLLVAIALMGIRFLIDTIMTLVNNFSATAVVSIVADGMLTSWFINAFIDGVDWARTFYLLAFFLIPVSVLVYPVPVLLGCGLVTQALYVIVCVILLLPSVSDWFRRV